MRIALIGYGKMGKAIEDVAKQRSHSIVLKISTNNLEDLTTANLQKADVVIEFTNPASAMDNIKKCFIAGVPVVCGTTGWLADWQEAKKECNAYNSTFLYASNFSIGVNIFFEINKRLAELMSQQDTYNIQLDETHHSQKKDAPSGTAITLAEDILLKISEKKKWVNSKSNNSNELSILSYRIDAVPGTHSVKYTSPVDDIEIIHTAHNRTGFANGAVLAAEYIYGKKGLFTMKDVLGI